MKNTVFALALLIPGAFAAAEAGQCYPVGRAAFDVACYDFASKDQCLDESDRTTCGWNDEEPGVCIPNGRASTDTECFKFRSKSQCLNTADIFACVWAVEE
jgi:hypothetical protein